jgi:hypothetical protein
MNEPTERKDEQDRTGTAIPAPRSKSALIKIIELLVGIPIALAFSVFLLVLLYVTFPDATGIGELARQREESTRVRSQLGFEDQVGDEALAVLSAVYRNVESKPATSVTWSTAQVGAPLEDRHAVKSAGRSSATITFDENNVLNLSEKSLVVVRKPRPRFGSRRRHASVLVVDGSLRAKLGGASHEDSVQVELVTAGGSVRSADPGRATEIQLDAGPDGPATLSVFQGDAEVRWGDTTILVPSDHAVSLDSSGLPGRPVRLPRRPFLVTPADGQVFTYRAATSRIPFSWKTADGTTDFGIAIARDPEFEDVVYEDHVERQEFVHGHLAAGRYYWRTHGVRDTARGPASQTRSFEVVLDQTAPRLAVSLPEDPVGGRSVVVRGATEPGSLVFIGETRVPTDGEGRFEHELQLREGYNFVVVQAVDPAGNTTFQSQEITAGFANTKRSS